MLQSVVGVVLTPTEQTEQRFASDLFASQAQAVYCQHSACHTGIKFRLRQPLDSCDLPAGPVALRCVVTVVRSSMCVIISDDVSV